MTRQGQEEGGGMMRGDQAVDETQWTTHHEG
jgi:hypothetical protein